MTTFEIIVTIAIIIIVILLVIVVLLVWLIHRINKINVNYTEQFDIMCNFLSGIRCDTVDIFQELNNIEDNIFNDISDTQTT